MVSFVLEKFVCYLAFYHPTIVRYRHSLSHPETPAPWGPALKVSSIISQHIFLSFVFFFFASLFENIFSQLEKHWDIKIISTKSTIRVRFANGMDTGVGGVVRTENENGLKLYRRNVLSFNILWDNNAKVRAMRMGVGTGSLVSLCLIKIRGYVDWDAKRLSMTRPDQGMFTLGNIFYKWFR